MLQPLSFVLPCIEAGSVRSDGLLLLVFIIIIIIIIIIVLIITR